MMIFNLAISRFFCCTCTPFGPFGIVSLVGTSEARPDDVPKVQRDEDSGHLNAPYLVVAFDELSDLIDVAWFVIHLIGW